MFQKWENMCFYFSYTIFYLSLQKEIERIMNDNLITSAQNQKVKLLLQLQQKSSERRKSGLFVVEGRRELLHCIEAGYEVDTVFYCGSLTPEGGSHPEGFELRVDGQTHIIRGCRTFEVSKEVYEKVAYRGGTEGVIAEVKTKSHTLHNLKMKENPLIVVLESVEKPGNLGAILRSADAAAVDAVIVCDPLTDLYNPNLIRSSLGGIFTVPCVACSSEECIEFLKTHGIQILTAQLQDSHLYYDIDMKRATAIIMGTESTGLTGQWRKAADAHIRIPMLGRLDSLNVSISSAILMYEAVRQRKN